MDLGNRIRELRKERGLSQEALAEKMGVSRQAVSKWEDNTSRPSTANLIELSGFFGVSLNELVGHDTDLDLKESAPIEPPRRKVLKFLLSASTAVLLVTVLYLCVTTIFSFVGIVNGADVIGGADGPTAIFVTGPSTWLYVVWAVCVVMIIVSLVLLIRSKNK